MASSREEKFAKPKIVCAFLPVDAPIKATVEMDFGEVLKPLVRPGKEEAVAELTAALTSARQMVLWALDRDRTLVSTDELVSRLGEYGRLLRGFVARPSGDAEAKGKVAKTLRHAVGYVWRDLLDVKGRDWRASDVALEEASVLLAAAQAVLSRSAREAVSDSNALELHSSLRRVAGMLARARALVDEADAVAMESAEEETVHEDEEKSERVEEGEGSEKPPEKEKKKSSSWFSSSKKKKKAEDDTIKSQAMDSKNRASADLRLALPEAWAQLALAEAQHATLRKACLQTHIDWSLVAALCVDEQDRYATAVEGHVQALTKAAPEASNVREWAGKRVALRFLQSHVNMKALYFEALVFYCQGAAMLERAVAETDENECCKAVTHLTQAARKHKEAQAAAEKFVATAKPITYVDSPIVALAESFDLVRKALDRANQLNNSIFHKPPAETTDPWPERKSLIAAIPYDDPGVSPLWTVAAWDAFDPDKLPDPPAFGFASDSRDCCTIS